MSSVFGLDAPAALPFLNEKEALALGFAIRTLKAARLRGLAPTLYRAALRSATLRTAGGAAIEYQRRNAS